MRRTSVMAVLAAALLTAGCGLGDNAPHPGVAAEVDGHVLSDHDLDSLVDAVCIATTYDPRGGATTRAVVARQEVKEWIGAQAALEYAVRHHVQTPTSTRDLSNLPGWQRMTSAEQDVLQRFADEQNEAQAVLKTPGIGRPRPSSFHIVIDPRFDLGVDGTGFVDTDRQLSIPVSKEALAGQSQPTPQQLQAMPAGQVCGNPDAAGPVAG